MKALPEFDPALPQRLEDFLLVRGWSITGASEGRYVRLSPRSTDDGPQSSLLIPLDSTTADYADLVSEALDFAVQRFDLASSRVELWDLLALSAKDDIFKYSKESELPDGSIDWVSGEAMVESLRISLLSSAKATVEKKPYYGHKFANFASRYLATVRMGQTERGSFIVTAHSLSTTQIPTSNAAKFRGQTAIEGAVITAGEISATLTRALSTARAVIDESRKSGQVEVFGDAISDGVSKDLVSGLKLATSSEGYTITSVTRAAFSGEQPKPSVVTFEHEDFGVLETAESWLAAASPKLKVSVVGWVKVVSRPEQGKPGVVSVVVLSGSEANQIKVRLSEKDFAIALEAIRQERLLEVRGTQEQDSASFWIYDARVALAASTRLEPAQRDSDLFGSE